MNVRRTVWFHSLSLCCFSLTFGIKISHCFMFIALYPEIFCLTIRMHIYLICTYSPFLLVHLANTSSLRFSSSISLNLFWCFPSSRMTFPFFSIFIPISTIVTVTSTSIFYCIYFYTGLSLSVYLRFFKAEVMSHSFLYPQSLTCPINAWKINAFSKLKDIS